MGRLRQWFRGSGRCRAPLAWIVSLLLALALLSGIPVAIAGAQAAGEVARPGCATNPSFISLEGRRVLELRAAAGAQQPESAARRGTAELTSLAEKRSISMQRLVVKEKPPYSIIGIENEDGSFKQKLAVDDRMAACFQLSRQQLAERYRDAMRTAVLTYRKSHTLSSWLRGTALAALVLGVYILWLRTQLGLNRWVEAWINQRRNFLLQRLTPSGLTQLVETDHVRRILQSLRQLVHGSLLLLVSYLLIPLLLGFFPPTVAIAEGLRGQILALVLGFLNAVVQAIPNLLSIAVILAITVLTIRASNAWFQTLHQGHIRVPGFYQEWALPTARLVTILLSLAGIAVAFPYIPGSDSKAFQGAGLFLGVLAALGSSAIATNVISGLMLIYTRAFREGDRVEINGTVGIVQDRALLVTRVQTPRNELVSIPNAAVIGASVVNYSFSRREISQPVALATTITIGYDVPWRQVHALMLAAARSVKSLSEEIAPFVLQTSLNDFHISYELTAYVRDPDTYRQSLSDVLAALQDQFAAADVEILSPGYHAIRNGNRSTVPPPANPQGS